MTSALNIESLIKAATNAREKAIAPYSGFKVGSAVLAASGKVYTGCNIENSSYGLTMCAERVAIFKALSEGENRILAVAVVAGSKEICRPCGACRQVLQDFARDARIISATLDGQRVTETMSQLLPGPFDDRILSRE